MVFPLHLPAGIPKCFWQPRLRSLAPYFSQRLPLCHPMLTTVPLLLRVLSLPFWLVVFCVLWEVSLPRCEMASLKQTGESFIADFRKNHFVLHSLTFVFRLHRGKGPSREKIPRNIAWEDGHELGNSSKTHPVCNSSCSRVTELLCLNLSHRQPSSQKRQCHQHCVPALRAPWAGHWPFPELLLALACEAAAAAGQQAGSCSPAQCRAAWHTLAGHHAVLQGQDRLKRFLTNAVCLPHFLPVPTLLVSSETGLYHAKL